MPTEKRYIVLEALPGLFATLPALPLQLFAAYECSGARGDMLSALVDALVEARSLGVEGTSMLALEALLDVLAASTSEVASAAALPRRPTPPPAPRRRASRRLLVALREAKVVVSAAARTFNDKPKHGLEQIQTLGLVASPPDAPEVARFLRATPQISKAALGDFLSEPKPFNASVLTEFTALLDFGALDIDGALRVFLKTFRLPGEAQKIDRLMDAFAAAYFTANPGGPIAKPDAAYVLAFAIIMLNTDSHNPSIKPENKMTLEGFVRQVAGANDNKDFPRPLLSASTTRSRRTRSACPRRSSLSKGGWRSMGTALCSAAGTSAASVRGGRRRRRRRRRRGALSDGGGGAAAARRSRTASRSRRLRSRSSTRCRCAPRSSRSPRRPPSPRAGGPVARRDARGHPARSYRRCWPSRRAPGRADAPHNHGGAGSASGLAPQLLGGGSGGGGGGGGAAAMGDIAGPRKVVTPAAPLSTAGSGTAAPPADDAAAGSGWCGGGGGGGGERRRGADNEAPPPPPPPPRRAYRRRGPPAKGDALRGGALLTDERVLP